MILIIDNSKNYDHAKMTPKIVNILKKNDRKFRIINSKTTLLNLVNNNKNNIKGIILSGGPLCLSNPCNYRDLSKNYLALSLFENIPKLGICFGFQIICDFYGSIIKKLKNINKGVRKVNLVNKNNFTLLKNLPTICNLFFSHNDYVINKPINFQALYYNNMILGIQNLEKKIYGFQFHPEGSKDGIKIIENFINYCYN